MFWDTWKKGFGLWEERTAQFTEQLLKSPLVLEPAGSMLSTAMKMKALGDQAVAGFWASVGLPTRQDQERTLHLLNQLQSRIIDLEERLAEAPRSDVD